MKCVYEDRNGVCTIWEEGLIWNGITEEGICLCVEEGDPSKFCSLFALDNPDGADCN